MKRLPRLALTIASTALALLVASPSYAGKCDRIAFSSNENNGGAWADSFSARAVLDVDVSVLVTTAEINRFRGDHLIEVRFYTPRGFLYQSMTIPVSFDKHKKGSKKRVDGYPRSLPVSVLEEVTVNGKKYYAASVRLPVGGTMITSNSLYGEWSVEAFADSLPFGDCTVRASFTINE